MTGRLRTETLSVKRDGDFDISKDFNTNKSLGIQSWANGK